MDDDAGRFRAARAFNQNKKGAAMHYIISILAAMLIGTGFGALFSPRSTILVIGYLASIVLGIVTIVSPSWMPLAIGTAFLLLAQTFQRDAAPATARA